MVTPPPPPHPPANTGDGGKTCRGLVIPDTLAGSTIRGTRTAWRPCQGFLQCAHTDLSDGIILNHAPTFYNLSAIYYLIHYYTSSHLLFLVCGLYSLESSMVLALSSLFINSFVSYQYLTGEHLLAGNLFQDTEILFKKYILKKHEFE